MNNQDISLIVNLRADGRAFVRPVSQAKSAVSKLTSEVKNASESFFGMKLAAAAAGGGLGLLLQQQIELSSETARVADRLQISTEALSRLHYAAGQTGINNMNGLLIDMHERLGEVTEQSGEGHEAILKLGLSLSGIQKKTPNQQLKIMADALKNVNGQGEKLFALRQIFGDAGDQMYTLLSKGSKGIAELEAESDKLGATLSTKTSESILSANTALKRLGAVAAGAKNDLVGGMAPAIEVVANNIDALSTTLVVGLAAATGKATAMLHTKTSATIKETRALRVQNLAALSVAKEEVRLNQIRLNSVRGLSVAAAMEERLATSRAKLKNLTKQTSLLTAAMSPLGGWVGLGVFATVAAGFALMSAGANDAANSTRSAAEAADLYSRSLENMGKKQLAAHKLTISNTLEEEEKRLSILNARIETLNNQMRFSHKRSEKSESVILLEGKIEELSLSIKEGRSTVSEIKNLLSTTNKQTIDPGQQKSALQKLATLKQQNALLGKNSQLEKLNYEIQFGGLKKIDTKTKGLLQIEANLLDIAQQQIEATKKHAEEKKRLQEVSSYTEKLKSEKEKQRAIQLAPATGESALLIGEKFAYGQRIKSLNDFFQERRSAIGEDFILQEELDRQHKIAKEALEEQHQMNITKIAVDQAKRRKSEQDQIQQSTVDFMEQKLSLTTDLMRQAGDEQSGISKALFAIQKALNISTMIMDTETATNKAMKLEPVDTRGIPMAAMVRAAGYASVGIVAGQALAGIAHNGLDRVPKNNEGTFLLKKDEMVLNPQQADNMRWMKDQVDAIKRQQQQSRASNTPQSLTIKFEGLPDGYEAEQRQMSDGEIVVAIKKSSKAASDDAYNRVAKDLRTRSGKVGRSV